MNTYYNFISLENEDIETASAYYLIEIAEEKSFKFCASPVPPNEIHMDPYTHIKYYWPMYYSSILQSHKALLFPNDPKDPNNPIKPLRSETLSRDDISIIFGMDPTIIHPYQFGHVPQSEQVIKSLIESLSIHHERLMNYIYSELLTLSIDVKNKSTIRTVILQKNNVESLFPLINSTDITIQSQALNRLACIISREPNDDITFCTKYIPAFIALLASDNQNIRRDASSNLYRLSQNDQNKKIIRHQKGILPLVALLADSDKETYCYALFTLSCLSSMRSNRKEILKANALSSLMNGLDGHHLGVIAKIMVALSHFLMDAATFIQGDIFTRKNISLIVSFLCSYDQETVRNAAYALSRIALIDQHRKTIFNANGLVILVDLLRTNNDVQTRRYITTTLSQFSNDSRHNTVLIRKVQYTTQLSMLLASKDPDTQYYAAVMLQNLSCHDENRFFSRNIINRLICLLSSSVDRIASSAAYALGHLALNDEKQRFIVEEQGIPLFFDWLESSSMEKNRSAIYALSILSLYPNHHAAIFSMNGIAKMMLLLTSSDIKTKSHAIYALGHLAKNKDTLDITYYSQAILARLLPLLKEKDQGIQCALIYMLSIITQRPLNRSILYDTQNITSLIHLLTSRDIETRCYAARTLSNIAFHHESAHAISNSSTIQLLVDLLLSNDKATKDILTKRYVTSTLSSLSLIRKNKQSIRHANGIKALIATLATADILTMRYAAMALGHLALDLENQIQIRREHGLLPLISLLSFPDAESQYYAVKALAFLSINVSNQNIICGLNSMSALRCLINSNERLTRRYALLTISNLTRHPINAVVMREVSIIEALLSCLFFRTFHTQGSPFEKDELLIKHYAFIALNNLARDKDNQAFIKRKVSHIDNQSRPWDPISEKYVAKLSKIADINTGLMTQSMCRDAPSSASSVDDLNESICWSW